MENQINGHCGVRESGNWNINYKIGNVNIGMVEEDFDWFNDYEYNSNPKENNDDSVGDFCKHIEDSVGDWFNDYEYDDKDVISFENIVGDGGEQDYHQYLNNELNIGEKIEDIIKTTVHNILNKSKYIEMPNDIIETDNIGEVIEKLAILNCRMWYLEDACGLATSDEELASLKRKIDICFKQKRPKYVQAINRMIDKSIIDGKSLVEDSVKLYQGY
jgi:hypothetical protein